MAKATTLYHGALREMGPVRVTVKSDVLKSKYSKPNAPKPDYVELHIGGVAYYYSTENPNCAEFFRGQKGRTFTIVAEGDRDEASIVYVGEAPEENKPNTPPPAPHTPPPPPRTPPVSRPPAAAAPAPAVNTPPSVSAKAHVPLGMTVGMAMNNACNSLTAQGCQLSPRKVFEIASDLLRVSYELEAGKLAKPFKERHPGPTTTPAQHPPSTEESGF